jgi:1,4-dihydroxy-2-naphthoate octaprenyltransferase
LGDAGTRRFYLLLVAVPFLAAVAVIPVHPWAVLALFALQLAALPVRTVTGGAQGLALLPVLSGTGRLALIYAVLLGVGLAL